MIRRKKLIGFALFFSAVLVYAVLAMTAAREIIVPHMLPSAGGNIAGDPQYYTSLALKKTAEIREHGFAAFELRPEGQGPAGVASLMFLLIDKPYVIVLMNALLHAVSTVVMVLILEFWFSRRTAMIASLPIAFSPYMIVWFSQLNKDSFSLAGALLFMYGLLRLVNPARSVRSQNDWMFSLLIAVGGIFLMFIVRPYLNQILLPATVCILLGVLVFQMRSRLKSCEVLKFLMAGAILLFCLSLLSKGARSDATLGLLEGPNAVSKLGAVLQVGGVADKCFASIDERNWKNEAFFPNVVNAKLKSMMGQRCLTFTLLDTQDNPATIFSIIDADKLPDGSLEALAYLPRAALIGILTPWPDRWFYNFNHQPSSFYAIVPLEAAMLYLGLVCLFVWLVRGKEWHLLIPIILSVSVMSVHGMANPFIGGLYRYRFPWWMLLMCLGVAAFIELTSRSAARPNIHDR